MAQTVTVTYAQVNGKAIITTTTVNENPDGSEQTTINASKPLTRAEVVNQQNNVQNGVNNLTAQLTALGQAVADVTLK
jgi:hypothetical protein